MVLVLLPVVGLPLGKGTAHNALDPLVEVRRLERVHAFVEGVPGDREVVGKNLAELRGKGHAALAVDLQTELAIQIHLAARRIFSDSVVDGCGQGFLSPAAF